MENSHLYEQPVKKPKLRLVTEWAVSAIVALASSFVVFNAGIAYDRYMVGKNIPPKTAVVTTANPANPDKPISKGNVRKHLKSGEANSRGVERLDYLQSYIPYKDWKQKLKKIGWTDEDFDKYAIMQWEKTLIKLDGKDYMIETEKKRVPQLVEIKTWIQQLKDQGLTTKDITKLIVQMWEQTLLQKDGKAFILDVVPEKVTAIQKGDNPDYQQKPDDSKNGNDVPPPIGSGSFISIKVI